MTDKQLKYRAIELLRYINTELEEGYGFQESDIYPVIIKTNNRAGLLHFFLLDEMGALYYDGWSREPCIPINDMCEN